MRIDFDFHGHGGYAVIHRALIFALPPNYEFSFDIKGDAPTNTLEFKLVDSTGDNVWWSNNPNFVFPRDWKTITRKKRQISFAWGPTTDKDLKRFAAIEIAITAGSGGKGSVWLDNLAVTPLDPATSYVMPPRITRTTNGDTINLDLQRRSEFGGMVIQWEPGRRAASYEVQGSRDGQSWHPLYTVNRTPGAQLPVTATRSSRLAANASPPLRDWS